MSKTKTEKAATKAAKAIKRLKKPTGSKIRAIYQEFQSAADQYTHMP